MKKRGTVIILFLLILILGIVIHESKDILFTNCIDIIYANWEVKLPSPTKELFCENGPSSFHGDGERYHVFEYENEEDIKSAFVWNNEKTNFINEGFEKVLEGLQSYDEVEKIPENYIPNLNEDYKYYTKSLEDNSKLYLVYIPGVKKIFVGEDIF